MEPSITTTRSTPRLINAALALILGLLSFAAAPARAERELLQLFVGQPYLELHTGPGRGYPVTQVVARGESVDVLFRRTEWFKVRTERGIEGWAYERDLLLTTRADGMPFSINLGDRAGFTSHRWEMGVMAGAYSGATLISAYSALSLTDSLQVELALGQFLGNASDGYVADLGLAHIFMPQTRFSPFVTLGGGVQRLVPKVTFAAPQNSNDETAYIGVGGRYYLTRRFFIRGEYRAHVVFTNVNSNEVKEEWKVGFAFFY